MVDNNKLESVPRFIRDPTFITGTDKHTHLEKAAAIGRCKSFGSDMCESSANIFDLMLSLMTWHLDDAKQCLHFSIKTVKTRAQLRKRKAAEEAEAAQRAEEQRKQVIGAARMAKKAKIFERPTKSERVVDNCGRIKYF